MQLNRPQRAAGYTLTEILAAVAILSILIGGLTPMVVMQIEKARKARAQKDIAAIAESLKNFRDDVKAFPDRRNGRPGVLGYLTSEGQRPSGLSSWQGPRERMSRHLLENNPSGADYPTDGIASWRGPYVVSTLTDPWGRAYVISLAGLRGEAGSNGWILSAGPNGTLETDDGADAVSADSDDLGWRLR